MSQESESFIDGWEITLVMPVFLKAKNSNIYLAFFRTSIHSHIQPHTYSMSFVD